MRTLILTSLICFSGILHANNTSFDKTRVLIKKSATLARKKHIKLPHQHQILNASKISLTTQKNNPLPILNDLYKAKNPLTTDANHAHFSSNHKAIIGGIAKNIEGDYDRFELNIENLRNQFRDSTVVIVTDGNQDKTEELLDNYAKLHSNTHIFKIDNPGTHRTDKIAYARNVFMDKSAQFFDSHDYLISFDFDVYAVQAETINHALAHKEQWDVATVNPLKIYYDKWALRTEADNISCWGNDKNPGYRCANPMMHWFPGANIGDGIPVDHAPLKVQSAFGGLGLYKTKILAECRSKPGGCKYAGEDSDGFGDCEHVVFHKNLREKAGARIYIWPSMTILHVNHKDTQL